MFDSIKNKLATYGIGPRVLYAVIVVVILVVIYAVASMNVAPNENYLTGMWVGDDLFCEEAEIDSMLLYIGEPVDGRMRNGYIVIQADGEMVSQGFMFEHRPGWAGPSIGGYTVHGIIDFEDDPIWSDDGRITITTDMRTGLMRIYHKDQLYARLYKSMELSALRFDDDVDE